jgi:hypothetical protein
MGSEEDRPIFSLIYVISQHHVLFSRYPVPLSSFDNARRSRSAADYVNNARNLPSAPDPHRSPANGHASVLCAISRIFTARSGESRLA